jgi:hypothetical protein
MTQEREQWTNVINVIVLGGSMAKRLAVSSTIILTVFVILAQSFAAVRQTEPKSAEQRKAERARRREAERRQKWDPNSVVAGIDFLADPNAIENKLKEFKGLKKALKSLNDKGRDERKEWRRVRSDEDDIEDRRDFAKALQGQLIAELSMIREVALEENAEKTVAAIEGLLLDRQQRYAEVLKDLQKSLKRLEERERNRRRNRRSSRER